MNVDLPDTGCNVINSSSSFYNYSPDYRTRTTYYIYEGVAHVSSSTYNGNGYSVTGTCLSDGDLVFKPEIEVFFPFMAFCSICFLMILIYRIFIKRLLP